MNKVVKGLVTLAALGTLFLSCGPNISPAFGRIREIAVASDWWSKVEPVVRAILEDTIPTPQPEPRFMLRAYNENQFQSYHLLRSVFFVGTSSDTVIRAILGHRVDSLPGGDFGFFQVPNAWAERQQLVLFVARNDSLLLPGLELYRERIRSTFQNIVLGHSARAVYYKGRDEQKARELLARYAFSLDVPRGWYLKEERADSHFVYLFAHYPDRGVFVFWQDSERPLLSGSLMALRDSLTGRYYQGDRTERSYAVAETVGFLSGPALRLQGVWQNDKEIMGGPFVSYCFNHEGRFFMVDGLVFQPGKPKLDQLLQVETIVRSFTPQ